MPPQNRRESYRTNHRKQSVFTQPGPRAECARKNWQRVGGESPPTGAAGAFGRHELIAPWCTTNASNDCGTSPLSLQRWRGSRAISSVTSGEVPAEALNTTTSTRLAILGRSRLQRAHIGDEIIDLGIGRHAAGVHLLGVDVPHELDRVAQRRGAPVVEVGRG
jgi:hypothetical protein